MVGAYKKELFIMWEDYIVCPDRIRVIERAVGGWLFKRAEMFYRKRQLAVDFEDYELLYGISKQRVAFELFRINAGKAGYYLADLRHKNYYYCGLEVKDIKMMLRSLGIGRAAPHED